MRRALHKTGTYTKATAFSVVATQHVLAQLCMLVQDFIAAKDHLEACLALRRQHQPAPDAEMATLLHELGWLCLRQQRVLPHGPGRRELRMRACQELPQDRGWT